MTSSDPVRQDQAVQTAAEQLFMGSAPERHQELQTLWQLLGPRFQLVGDCQSASEGDPGSALKRDPTV